MNRVAALVCCVSVLAAQSGRNAGLAVSAIRHWSLSDVTRIAVQVSGDFEFRTDFARALLHIPQAPMSVAMLRPIDVEAATVIRHGQFQPLGAV